MKKNLRHCLQSVKEATSKTIRLYISTLTIDYITNAPILSILIPDIEYMMPISLFTVTISQLGVVQLQGQELPHLADELHCLAVLVPAHLRSVVHNQCQVLCHKSLLHRLYYTSLQGLTEYCQFGVIVELSAVQEASRPSKDAGD